MAADSTPNPLRNTVGKALGRIPSGLFILSVQERENAVAMLASWVQQAAFDPPVVSVGIGKDRGIREIILRTRKFGLSVLGDGDKDLMRHFARPRDVGQDPFDGIERLTVPSGLPIVAKSLAWMDCELIEAVEFGGDHQLILARVVDGNLLREGHSFTHVRGNGFHY